MNTNTSTTDELDNVIFRCFAQGQYWGTKNDEGQLDHDYKPAQPIDRTEANKLILALINKARIEGELAGRSDELVKLSEWGKTIDTQWNTHFEQRLAALKETS